MTAAKNAAGRKRIYLAGFDVFRIDAIEHGQSLRRLCAGFGFEGVYPLDSIAPAGLPPRDKAAWVYRANVTAISSSDIVMANVADFRGAGEPDSGTAFEIGFAAALGKDVWGYRDDLTALRDHVPSTTTPAGLICERGYIVEDFELPVNLMLACAARIVKGDPAACLEAMADAYGIGSTPSPYRQDGGSEIRLAEG